MLHTHWPNSTITGVDSSQEMLEKAKIDGDGINWIQADLNSWEPETQADLIFSNATLHWLDNHETLLPRLMGLVSSNGILAVQMPNNFNSPTHRCIFDTIESRDWGIDFAGLYRGQPVLEASAYHQLLEPFSSEIWIWETTYLHVLKGDNPVVQWTKGSVLRPFLQVLSSERAEKFETEYSRRILEAYPSVNGITYMPFKRLFMVVRAK